jgi:phosphate transport system permease protein
VGTTHDAPRAAGKPVRRLGDRVFSGLSTGAACLILIALAGIAVFLTSQGLPGMTAAPSEVRSGQAFLPYVLPLAYGTLMAAVLALGMAIPIAIGVALYISHYAPRSIASLLGYLVDLLAAVPSVVYGLWGIGWLARHLVPLYDWLNTNLGSLPFFAGPPSPTGRTILTASIVLAVMVLPIVTAICREIFLQTPRLHQEAALALGATRWEMVRYAVLPFGRSGIVSASMLGLGRALGETMAVAMVLSATGIVSVNLISSTNPSTIAANIALTFKEASGLSVNALIASGLVLFLITFAVNVAARWIINRRRDFLEAT